MPLGQALELVAGATLGSLFGELYKGVEDLIRKSVQFKPHLDNIKHMLDSLEPLIKQIEDHNTELDLSNKEIENLTKTMSKGIHRVGEFLKVRKWDLISKAHCTKKLRALEESLKRQLEILNVQGIRDGKEAVILARQHANQLDESVRDGKETLVLAKKNTIQLVKSARYQKEMLFWMRFMATEWKKSNPCLKDVSEINRNVLVRNQVRIKDSSLPVGLDVPLKVNRSKDAPNIDQNDLVCDQTKIRTSSFTVGLDMPLKELKMKLLKDDGASILVLTGLGGCGKTTLAEKFCQDEQVKDNFKNNIFFVTVSTKPNLDLIVQELHQCMGSQVPTFQNEVIAVKWLEQFLKGAGKNPLLLVLDDVWPGSEFLLEKLDELKMPNNKILVTSRFEFLRFGSAYYLDTLNPEDAMALFHHSASFGDRSSYVPEYYSRKIVERCEGLPLAITVVGRSLCGQPIEIWEKRVLEWSTGSSILYFETDLLVCLRSSLEFLEKENAIVKECFLDLGSFAEDQRIPVVALIDMWAELYELDEDILSIANLNELTTRSLANFVRTRSERWDIMDGYYSEHFVTQHDLLRELAIFQSCQDPVRQRKRLIINIWGDDIPEWWTEQTYPIMASIVSISTDEVFSTKWPNMELPVAEVLLLNFQTNNYALPEFVEKMDELKVLIVTNYGFSLAELSNFQLLGSLLNLKRIRLERISIPSITKNSMQLKSLHKISLFMCNIGQAFSNYSIPITNAFPNLLEMNIDYCDDLVELPTELDDLIHLKKLSITNCHKLSALPERIGNLVNLQVLRLRSCTGLLELPASIRNLKILNFLDISNCSRIKRLPEDIGEVCSLEKLNMRQCSRLQELPLSVLDLELLKDVICDEETGKLWEFFLPLLKNVRLKVVKEDINLNWLATPFSANPVITRTERREVIGNRVEADELPGEFKDDELYAEFKADELHAEFEVEDLHAKFKADENAEFKVDELSAVFELKADELNAGFEFKADELNVGFELKANELNAEFKADELHAEFTADELHAELKVEYTEIKAEIKALREELTNKLDLSVNKFHVSTDLLVRLIQTRNEERRGRRKWNGKAWTFKNQQTFRKGRTVRVPHIVPMLTPSQETQKEVAHKLPTVGNFCPILGTEQQTMRQFLAWAKNPNVRWRNLEILDAPKEWFVELLTSGSWLTDSHVDVFLHYVRKKAHIHSQSFSRCCTILDTLFWSYMNGRWEAFRINPNSYKWDSIIMNYPLGKLPKYTRPWSEVDCLYLPVSVNNQHWVAVSVDLMRRKLTIYDSMRSATRDEFICDILKPVATMLPSLLVQSGFYALRPELSPLSIPFTVVRLAEDIPQQSLDGDCGVFMLMYMEYLSLGQPLSFTQADMQLFRRRMALGMFAMTHDIQ